MWNACERACPVNKNKIGPWERRAGGNRNQESGRRAGPGARVDRGFWMPQTAVVVWWWLVVGGWLAGLMFRRRAQGSLTLPDLSGSLALCPLAMRLRCDGPLPVADLVQAGLRASSGKHARTNSRRPRAKTASPISLQRKENALGCLGSALSQGNSRGIPNRERRCGRYA